MVASKKSADHNAITTAVGLMLFAGITTLYLFLRQATQRQSEKKLKRKDILKSILQNTAPVAASNELKLLPPGCHTCERRLDGNPLILTKDPLVADYIFNGSNRGNYVQRPASDDGLKKLGMFCSGIIWNNNTPL